MLGQGNTKGPDPLSSDQPVKLLAGELSSEDQKKLVLQAYRKLKETFADFSKPDGDKETPAKTCRDLLAAHPDKPSGEVRPFLIERKYEMWQIHSIVQPLPLESATVHPLGA